MKMTIILAMSCLLASLPLVIAAFFRIFTLPRKVQAVTADVQRLEGTGDGNISAGQGETARSRKHSAPDIPGLAKKYFASSTLAIPSVLLTTFYFAAFLLCDSYLKLRFVEKANAWFFPNEFVEACVPLLYAFTGVYLFNLGTMIRRLYLADITEQVFWAGVNRLLLSMGLALVIMKSGAEHWGAEVYFTIGFLANIVLDWLLEKSLKLLNVTQPKQDDLPLQMVKGINIWKEYRLEEEGIENVQNLATADAVDLAVRTHYSARTLIDWIDQSIVLARLTSDQVKAMTSQAMGISAIELAAAAPANNNGDKTFANALAAKLNVDPVLMAATLDRLYEDEYVRILWELWQSGTETATSGRLRIPLSTQQAKGAGNGAEISPPATTSASGAAAGKP
jgi:hypothetical protein